MTDPVDQQPEGLPSLDSLDPIFTLPDYISDPEMRSWYEVIVARLQREAAHVPMTTVQELLLERIAHNYVVLRMREQSPAGTPEGFQSASQQKDYNTFWLTMTQEFNKQVRAISKEEKDQLNKKVVDAIGMAIRKADLTEEVMDRLLLLLSAELDRAGL